MRRRSRTGGEPVKTRRRKTAARKPRNAAAIEVRRSSATDQETEFARVIYERDQALEQLSEALEQQTATSDVLRVISSSPGELGPVFDTVLENATRLCEAHFGILYRFEDDAFRAIALRGAPPAFAEFQQSGPIRPTPVSGLGRIVSTRRPVHIIDAMAQQHYIDGDPYVVTAVKLSGSRTLIFVPMLKDDELIGSIAIYRREVRPFTDKQIELLTHFAAQAVIAIENTRLLNELRQRTTDLGESLEQQTATSEVLSVISSSPGELEPVFESMLTNATRLCEAKFGILYRCEGDALRTVAMHDAPQPFVEVRRNNPIIRPNPDTTLGRAMATKQPVQIADILEELDPLDARAAQLPKLAGARTVLAVPMLKENELVGAFVIYRTEVRLFNDKQIELVKNFAAQAVIAIENTRLLNELRQRTSDLSESLEQQTATSEVLRVISSSPGELEPVFNAMLANATRICEATSGHLWLLEGNTVRTVAILHSAQSYIDYRRRHPVYSLRENPGIPIDRLTNTKQVVHIPDLRTDQSYTEKNDRIVNLVEVAGARTFAAVPMLKEGELIGGISMYRQEVRPFTEKQIELVRNFAAQAVIAIENTRLLNELRESLEQQTATSDVLRVISSSPGELQLVFESMLANATRICQARFGTLYLREADGFRALATHNAPTPYVEDRKRDLVRPPPDSALGQVLNTHRITQVADITAVKSYIEGDPYLVSAVKLGGYRTIAAVPMLKDDLLIGAITINRQEVRPFTDKQIELVQNFAAQAVIAIENARLLNELRESLQQQTATADVLKIISRSTFNLQTVFQTLIESAVRLCEADTGSITREAGSTYLQVASYGYPAKLHEFMQSHPIELGRGTIIGRVVANGKAVQIADIAADPEFTFTQPVRLGNLRTMLGVPLLREGTPIGVIVLSRKTVRPFTDKQIELLATFADQAVIAIENVRLFEAEQQRTRELSESLEQQTATADVLRVISSSPGELQPVFEAMLENAVRLCAAQFAMLFLYEGNEFRAVATRDVPTAWAEYLKNNPIRAHPMIPMGRAISTKQPVHIPDAREDPAYIERFPGMVGLVELGGGRTLLQAPMIKENDVVGMIAIYRQEVRPFTDKQIELMKNFAAQAVIAIENTRLLNELRQSLEQQTATADVLRIISSSPGKLEPVFQAMLENAIRICEAKHGHMLLRDDDLFRAVAEVNTPPELADFLNRGPFEPTRGSHLDRMLRTGRLSHSADDTAESVQGIATKLGGARSLVGVPMLKDDYLIGAIFIYRTEVRPFTDKQIELVQNFSDQGVIAIENTRLLNELRQSLEQQTATAEVLRVISSSPTNVQPVFDSIAESAVRLCDGQFSFVVRFDGKVMDFASCFGLSAEGLDAFRSMMPMPARDDTASGRAILRRAVVEVADVKADDAYGVQAQGLARAVAYRSIVAVPLLHEGNPIGVITVARANAGAFPERQIALLQAFADQAVIAIRNVRLFDEVQARTEELSESLQQQTATADVLKVISRSTFDLKAVLNTLVETATRVCDADFGNIARPRDGDTFFIEATHGMSEEFIAEIDRRNYRVDRGSVIGRALLERKTMHIVDAQADPDYELSELGKHEGFRTLLGVPLMREGVPIGVFGLGRRSVRPFTDKQIELVTTFADQAVIATENVRLFDEIQDKSRQLEEASQHKSQFLANMSHELRTPLNAILGYTELMADGAYGEPSEKMMGILKRLEANGKHLLGLINDVLDLSKIEAGQLVLELSDYSVQDIAQTVRGTLEPLAADKKLAFKVEMAGELPPGHGDGRRLTQVLINLVGNAIKFTDAGEVAIKAEANNGSFHVSVRDTGPGISAADQAKLFQEFQQADNAITKKKGGTGLGLAISKRIIEMHGGRIWVESQPGQGSTFTFTLPVIVERQVETT